MLNKVFYKKCVHNTLENLNIAQLINTIQYTINDFSKKNHITYDYNNKNIKYLKDVKKQLLDIFLLNTGHDLYQYFFYLYTI